MSDAAIAAIAAADRRQAHHHHHYYNRYDIAALSDHVEIALVMKISAWMLIILHKQFINAYPTDELTFPVLEIRRITALYQ